VSNEVARRLRHFVIPQGSEQLGLCARVLQPKGRGFDTVMAGIKHGPNARVSCQCLLFAVAAMANAAVELQKF